VSYLLQVSILYLTEKGYELSPFIVQKERWGNTSGLPLFFRESLCVRASESENVHARERVSE
jgi:hypothetical protein